MVNKKLAQILFIEESELNTYRLFILLSIVYILSYGIIPKLFDPTVVEFISHRIIITCYFLLLFGLSFKKNEQISKYFSGLLFISFTVIMVWVSWIVWMNHFDPNYVLGLLVAFAAISVIYHYPLLIVVHTIFSLAMTIFFMTICVNPETSSIAIYLALVVVATTSLMSIIQRIKSSKKLEELNQKLEEKANKKTLELELNSKDLVDKNLELEQIAKVVSHDLKTPLFAIVSINNWLAEDYREKLDEKGSQLLSLMNEKAEYLFKLLDGISAYRQIDETNRKVEVIDVEALIQEIIIDEEWENSAHFKIGDLPKINFVLDHIYIVFHNLMHNSILHHHNKNDVLIEISCMEQETAYEFKISDNGSGIDKAYKHMIFNLFETLEAKDEGKTHGIGLAIVKRIISKTGGEIRLGQEQGGATFYFTIPK